MRLSLRFVLPLMVVLAALAYAVVPLVDTLTLKWFVRDLDTRSNIIARTMEAPLAELLAAKAETKILSYFHRIIQDERLYALGFCDTQNRPRIKTPTWPEEISCDRAASVQPGSSTVLKLKEGPVHLASFSIEGERGRLGRLLLVHDMSFVQTRSSDTKWYIVYLFAVMGAVISLVTVLVAHLSWKGWVAGVRAMLKGEGLFSPLEREHTPELRPVASDLRALVRELETDRRIRDESRISWTASTLRSILRKQLAGEEILIVSNREPYLHVRKGDSIEIELPASGVVSALEPVMRACSGVWIAHGNGSADREVVDARDHVRVPPEQPSYDIRRIWMSADEEMGYYYGFANEGLWPLCHHVHVRPAFRTSDWHQYVEINKRFAAAVEDETKSSDPVILVQDYHFALVPKMIRERLPNATIITFWHIPWP
ncbi:MAG TPA: trehalose-6-phosphate synthase, partial [Nitrospiraceae bacterium]